LRTSSALRFLKARATRRSICFTPRRSQPAQPCQAAQAGTRRTRQQCRCSHHMDRDKPSNTRS
jgi:hypothetical protein